MNEFIVCYEKRAEARYVRPNQRALARFLSQTPISIGGIGWQSGNRFRTGIALKMDDQSPIEEK
ncbi:MAG: hypothetical protein GWP17_06305 [Aquificales bacterium]|nr:hypothetical protein [Aquificales bacterium]